MQTPYIRRILLIVIPLILVAIAVTYLLLASEKDDGLLRASGTVEAVDVTVASELAGRVSEVFVEEGDFVQSGEALFQLEDDIYQAQRKKALAAVETAETSHTAAQAALETAQAALNSAQVNADAVNIQYEIALAAARMEELADRRIAWDQDQPYQFSLPVWYFQKDEKLASAEAEVDAAKEALEQERHNFESVMNQVTSGDLEQAESRLCDAQSDFLIADDLLDRARDQDDQELIDFAQTTYDSANSELDAAQSAYDELLTDQDREEILEARARLTYYQERYESALDQYNQLQTGEDSLQVQAAKAVVKEAEAAVALAEAQVTQAEANLTQAEKATAQAKAELDLIDIQISKLVVHAAVSGVISARNIEPGEVLQPGAVALTLNQLDTLTITVYIPEDRYGEIRLGDHVQVTIDSFPGEIIDAVVTRIADRAEFTPRNVQTEEGRRTTVFAVELFVDDPYSRLKPGMPADVTFNP
jgi:HlyD family secretion protein